MSDIPAGGVAHAHKRTLLRGMNEDGDNWSDGEIFAVVPGVGPDEEPAGDVDAIVGVGCKNAVGVSGQGVTGVVGTVASVTRDKQQEVAAMAGVLGIGGAVSDGVCGKGAVGVRGEGAVGVLGEGIPGVKGKGDVKTHPFGPGVEGEGVFKGVYGFATDADDPEAAGVHGHSKSGRGVFGESGIGPGGWFSSEKVAQIHLEPNAHTRQNVIEVSAAPTQLLEGPERQSFLHLPKKAKAGDLFAATVTIAGSESPVPRCTLWLCVVSAGRDADETPAEWVQLLTGTPVSGSA